MNLRMSTLSFGLLSNYERLFYCVMFDRVFIFAFSCSFIFSHFCLKHSLNTLMTVLIFCAFLVRSVRK